LLEKRRRYIPMSQSSRFRLLERRLEQLRKRLLPRVFSSTGNYSDLQLDRVRGYRLLIHAEIESFVEERASDVVNRAFNAWIVDKRPRHTIISLVAHCRIAEKKFDSCESAVGDSYGRFNLLVRSNNGIKEEDVFKILLPVGVEKSALDQTWLLTLSSFASARGEVAHRSVRVHQPIDPKTEYETVKLKLLPGLKDLDTIITGLLK